MSYPDFADYRAQADVFERMAFIAGDVMTLRGSNGGSPILAGMVTEDYFPLLRLHPALGRTLESSDFLPGASPAAVMGYRYWVSHFGSDPGVVGRTLAISTGSFTVVGVLRPGQGYPEWGPNFSSELYVPLPAMPYVVQKIQHRALRADGRVIARMKRGVTAAEAQRRLQVIAARLAAAYPASDSGRGVAMESLRQDAVGDVSVELTVLGAAVGLVFLLACADVANLALVRATARTRELAVRTALGAGHRRIARYLLTESVLLAGAGGVAGIGLAVVGVRVLRATSAVPRIDEIMVDYRALVGMVVTAGIAAVLCAAAPLAVTGRETLVAALKASKGAAPAGRTGVRLRGMIVGGQFAIAMTLVVGAGLLMRTFAQLRAVDVGYDDSHLIQWDGAYPHKGDNGPSRMALFRRELAAVAPIPGVASAAIAYLGLDTPASAVGGRAPADSVMVGFATVSPGYFSTLGIPLVRGRAFSEGDMASGAPVAIVSRVVAERLWPGMDPLGRSVTVVDVSTVDPAFGTRLSGTVIGVVGEIKRSLDQDQSSPIVYLPLGRAVVVRSELDIRTAGPPASLLPALRRALGAVDPDLQVSAMDLARSSLLSIGSGAQKFSISLLSAFSGVAMLLAILGLYGVMSFAVTCRTGEIGIRMALGARPADITHLFVGEAASLVVGGLVAGVAGGVVLGRMMRSLLYGVAPFDPVTFLTAASALAAVALLASYVASHRGAGVDPIVALRAD
jgi:putative ABC transport system permease protein